MVTCWKVEEPRVMITIPPFGLLERQVTLFERNKTSNILGFSVFVIVDELHRHQSRI